MHLPIGDSHAHLTYCLNIHPGETIDDIIGAIRRYTLPLRQRLAPGGPFGVGLRLGIRAVRDLGSASVRRAFAGFLSRHGLYVPTINAFPYGEFHDRTVREDVYAPDWSDAARVEFTRAVVDLIADLPRGTGPVSVSTVPGTWGEWARRDPDRAGEAGKNLVLFALDLDKLREERGVDVVLAVEPEPDCLWQNSEDVTVFFVQRIPAMLEELRRRGSLPADSVDAALQSVGRRLGVCLDACHFAVEFEEAADALDRLTRNGIRVPKVQVSAAPCSDRNAAETRFDIGLFTDNVYLHQTRVRDVSGDILRFTDIPDALAALENMPETCAIRTHVHIPLAAPGYRHLYSTRNELNGTFFQTLARAGVPHIELETYTFDVLPEDLRSPGLVDMLEAEYRWLIRAISRSPADGGR